MNKKYIDYEDAIKSLEFLGKIVIAEERGVSPLRSSLHSPSYDTVRDYIKRTNKLLTPPTEEEVCEALSEYFRNDMKHCEEVIFRQNKFIIVFESGGYSNVIDFTRQLLEEAPYLITMIGRFYEGLSDVSE